MAVQPVSGKSNFDREHFHRYREVALEQDRAVAAYYGESRAVERRPAPAVLGPELRELIRAEARRMVAEELAEQLPAALAYLLSRSEGNSNGRPQTKNRR
jgi:hypothetical protein